MKKAYSITDFRVVAFSVITFFITQSIAAVTDFTQDTLTTDHLFCDDTINVMSDVFIPDSVTLTICEGTVVRFTGHYMIEIEGRIVADGSPDGNEIIFTALNTTEGWRGIKLVNTDYNTLDSTLFDHCIFEYGNASDGDDAAYNEMYDAGGAIYMYISSKVCITNSEFRLNRGERYGGAIYLAWSGAKISGNRFKENIAFGQYGRGGAIFSYINYSLVQDNVFHGNSAKNGGALYSDRGKSRIVHNQFYANTSDYHAGCIYFMQDCRDTLIGNVIRQNTSQYGGALYFSTSNPLLVNNTIVDNIGQDLGGAIVCSQSSPYFENSIIWNNREDTILHQVSLRDTLSKPVFKYCLIGGGTAAFNDVGSGINYDSAMYYIHNIQDEPEFYDTCYYSPHQHSVCINAGNPGYKTDSTGVGTDILGRQRIMYDTVDIGACEYINNPPEGLSLESNQLEEGMPTGSVVGILTCTDADTTDLHFYELAEGDGDSGNAHFYIEGDTLKSGVTFDYENASGYFVRIKVTDNGRFPLSQEDQLNVDIVNVNEAPYDIQLSENTIAENSPAGTVIGDLTFSDPDTQTDNLTAELESGVNDNDAFDVNNNMLVSGLVFDYEDKNEYVITIRVTDNGGLTFAKEYTVEILDESETDLTNKLSDHMMDVFPNPLMQHQVLTISSSDEMIEVVRIADAGGTAWLEENTIHSTRWTIGNHRLEAGLYYIHIKTANASYYKKIIVY